MAGQIWAVSSLGGFMHAVNLSEKLRYALQPATKFRQFCDVKDAVGKNRGATFHWDIYNNVATQGGTLVETNTMPETNITINQGTLTITELGNSVPYSGKLEALAQHSVRVPLMRALRNDAKKAFDNRAYKDAFNSTLLRIQATKGTDTALVTLTTNGTAGTTNNVAFQKGHGKNIVETMKERNIPSYVDDDYVAVGWPSTFNTFRSDLESIHQYNPEGLHMIFNGEMGRYNQCRYVEQTHIPKGGAADSTTFDPDTNTGDAWNNGKSDWIFFFGMDTCVEGISIPEEIRAKIPDDYGRSKGIAWYYLGGFGKVAQVAAEERIVKWDSAA